MSNQNNRVVETVVAFLVGTTAVAALYLQQHHDRIEALERSAQLAAVEPPGTFAAITAEREATELDRFFAAIAKVETGGERDPDNAVGDKGASLGRYQIGFAYWRDANRLDTGFPTESIIDQYERDVRNPTTARAVMLAYWRRWCPEALAAGDWRTLARYHGCGATSARKGNGNEYADKVLAAMEGR